MYDSAHDRPLIQIPQDGAATVITMDYRGGYGAPRVDNRPLLTIFADGTIRVIDHSRTRISAKELRDLLRVIEDSGIKFSAEERQNFLRVDFDEHSDVGPEIEAKISAEELQDLLRFVIDEHHFFEFDSDTALREVEEEQRKIGLTWGVFDGLTTVIRIRTAERDHTGTFYALDDYGTIFPTLKPVANFSAVEKRLSRLAWEIRAEGKENIAAALKLANEHLRKTYPNVPALLFEDFLYIDNTPDARTMHFVRTLAERQPRDVKEGLRKVFFGGPEFSVAVAYLRDGTLKITVHNPPQ
jgi:hypothetical protein